MRGPALITQSLRVAKRRAGASPPATVVKATTVAPPPDTPRAQSDTPRAQSEGGDGTYRYAPGERECRKGGWSQEEDARLLGIIAQRGAGHWAKIAEELGGSRCGKQCRERWHNHLNPENKTEAWSTEEDELLLQLFRKHGRQWAAMARVIKGRTDNMIKNRFNSTIRRLLPEGESFSNTGIGVTRRKRGPKRVDSFDTQLADAREMADAVDPATDDDLATICGFGELLGGGRALDEAIIDIASVLDSAGSAAEYAQRAWPLDTPGGFHVHTVSKVTPMPSVRTVASLTLRGSVADSHDLTQRCAFARAALARDTWWGQV